MSQYLLSVWHALGVHAAGTARQSEDDEAARGWAALASYACGQRVELRRLAG